MSPGEAMVPVMVTTVTCPFEVRLFLPGQRNSGPAVQMYWNPVQPMELRSARNELRFTTGSDSLRGQALMNQPEDVLR
jgi:hypothetical protein